MSGRHGYPAILLDRSVPRRRRCRTIRCGRPACRRVPGTSTGWLGPVSARRLRSLGEPVARSGGRWRDAAGAGGCKRAGRSGARRAGRGRHIGGTAGEDDDARPGADVLGHAWSHNSGWSQVRVRSGRGHRSAPCPPVRREPNRRDSPAAKPGWPRAVLPCRLCPALWLSAPEVWAASSRAALATTRRRLPGQVRQGPAQTSPRPPAYRPLHPCPARTAGYQRS